MYDRPLEDTDLLSPRTLNLVRSSTRKKKKKKSTIPLCIAIFELCNTVCWGEECISFAKL